MLNLLSKTKYAKRSVVQVICCFGIFIAVSCNGSEFKSNAQVKNTPYVQNSSEQVALSLTESYGKNCKGFIDAFPNTFQKFNELYGYDDEKGKGGRLYSKYELHIPYFFECPDVATREKMIRVVDIGIDGKWDADAVGLFQESAFSLVKNNPNDATEILDKLSNDKASSFWFFLFDGPHPNDKENINKVDVIIRLFGNKSKQSKLLLVQVRKLRISEH